MDGTTWRLQERTISLREPVVMGVLNLTPDSFSDGGRLTDPDSTLRVAERMVEEGAGILDLGGESTRPGAPEVAADTELRRVIPTLRLLASRLPVPLSIDTRKAEVARAALDAGAEIVNDVSGLTFDPGLADVVAASGAGLVLMHMRGTPEDMTRRALYDDVVGEVAAELGASVQRARAAGIEDERIVIDPGIGFAKSAEQSVELLRRLEEFTDLGFPLLVGPSRKSFLGTLLDRPPRERVAGTVAACLAAVARGARIVRVHDVAPVADALRVMAAIEKGMPSEPVHRPVAGVTAGEEVLR